MTEMNILLIALIMYILSIFIYFKFNLKWVLIATILLWFVPIFLIENLFIQIFCVIMIIVTITITFLAKRGVLTMRLFKHKYLRVIKFNTDKSSTITYHLSDKFKPSF